MNATLPLSAGLLLQETGNLSSALPSRPNKKCHTPRFTVRIQRPDWKESELSPASFAQSHPKGKRYLLSNASIPFQLPGHNLQGKRGMGGGNLLSTNLFKTKKVHVGKSSQLLPSTPLSPPALLPFLFLSFSSSPLHATALPGCCSGRRGRELLRD